MNNLILVLLLLPFIVFAEIVPFTFEPPTQREDNTPLAISDISAYRVFVDGVHRRSVLATETSFSIHLDQGTYDVTMITVDTEGRKSVPSIAASITVGNSNPKPPVLQ